MQIYPNEKKKTTQSVSCDANIGIVHILWDENPYYIKSVSLIQKICTKIICDLLEPLFCYKHENTIVLGKQWIRVMDIYICPCLFIAPIKCFLFFKLFVIILLQLIVEREEAC